MLYVVTEHDSVYALDADSGAQLWQVSTLGTGETPSDDLGCGQITREIGITSTPVIDRSRGAHGTIYVVAMSKDASGGYHQRVHALDLATGAELLNGPTEVVATYPGSGANSCERPCRVRAVDVCRTRGLAAARRRDLHDVDLALRRRRVHGLGDGL